MNAKRPAPRLDRRDRRGVWLAVAGLVVLLGGLYVAGHFLLGDRLPTGTRIGGVGVGGLTPEEAEDRLAVDLGPNTKKKLTFYYEDREFTIDPRDVGLRLRISDSVDEAGGGRTWNPVRMLEKAVGADRIDPVVTADEDRLADRVDDITGSIDVAPVEPRVEFRGDEMRVRKPEAGLEVRRSELDEVIRDEFVQDREPIPLPIAVDRPDVNADEFGAAMRDRVRVAVGGPITVRAGAKRFSLSSDAVKSMLSYVSRGGRLTAKVDQGRFEHLVDANTESVRRPTRPATVVLRDGSPQAVADRPGRDVDTDGADAKVAKAIAHRSPKRRHVELDVVKTRSGFRKADAEQLGVRERIGSWMTPYPISRYGGQAGAARNVDGTVLRPGDGFSLDRSAGGSAALSPLATALFNGAFVSGLQGVERHPHRAFESDFTAGRDAVAGNGKDLRFRNDSKYGVLVHAWVTTGSRTGQVHVELWSTRRWTIETSVGNRRNVHRPEVRVKHGRKCVPQRGLTGFDIDLRRTLRKDGEKVRDDTVSTSYDARPRIRCRR